jgi:hypothetical protein
MELHRAVDAADNYRSELLNRLKYMKQAALETAGIDQKVVTEIIRLEKRLAEVSRLLNADASLTRREFEAPTSVSSRIGSMMASVVSSTSAPTKTFTDSYQAAASQFSPLLKELKAVGETVKSIDQQLEQSGAPYTPGRIP